jgi:hypothetical protein
MPVPKVARSASQGMSELANHETSFTGPSAKVSRRRLRVRVLFREDIPCEGFRQNFPDVSADSPKIGENPQKARIVVKNTTPLPHKMPQ